jgi:ribonuclease HI
MNQLIILFMDTYGLTLSAEHQLALRNKLSLLGEEMKQISSPTVPVLPNSIQAYSDGSCSGNPGAGGWGAILLINNETIELSGGAAITTNNRMELEGAIAVLDYLHKQRYSGSVSLSTDSQYVKNGITSWIKKWQTNGWLTSAKEPVKNKDLWQTLDNLNQQLKPKWQWVKGHAGHEYNERCDQLAVIARNQQKRK